MATTNQRGFTIIEVLLFLSISGLMFVALMAGVSTNINQQRYRDSVTSLGGLFQQQYAEVSNTRNGRDDNWRCDASIVEQDLSNGEARGASDCVLLGRYIRAVDNGTRVEIGSVVGTEPATGTVLQSDSIALAAYQPKLSTFEQTTRELEWGAVLRDADDRAANFTILILRSPLSGLVRTFANASSAPNPLADMITEEAAHRTLVMCVVGDGWALGPTQALVLTAATPGSNAVAIKGEASEC